MDEKKIPPRPIPLKPQIQKPNNPNFNNGNQLPPKKPVIAHTQEVKGQIPSKPPPKEEPKPLKPPKEPKPPKPEKPPKEPKVKEKKIKEKKVKEKKPRTPLSDQSVAVLYGCLGGFSLLCGIGALVLMFIL